MGEAKHPFNTTEMSPFLLQAQSSGAQMIALANAGTDTINAIKQAHEFRIGGGPRRRIVAMALFITDVHSLGLETAQGLYFTAGFYWDRDEASRAWSRRYFARMGTDADARARGDVFRDAPLPARASSPRGRRTRLRSWPG